MGLGARCWPLAVRERGVQKGGEGWGRTTGAVGLETLYGGGVGAGLNRLLRFIGAIGRFGGLAWVADRVDYVG